jgi:TPR repeat protein
VIFGIWSLAGETGRNFGLVSGRKNSGPGATSIAQSNLGLIYENGQGVTQDFLRAYMWINLAASKLSGVDGQRATTNRDRIAKSLTRG